MDLPSSSETGLGEVVTENIRTAIQRMPEKRGKYTKYTDSERQHRKICNESAVRTFEKKAIDNQKDIAAKSKPLKRGRKTILNSHIEGQLAKYDAFERSEVKVGT